MSKFMRVAQAAEYLDISPNTVRLWCNQGKLPFHRNVANQRVFYKKELDKFIREKMGLAELTPSETKIFYVRSSNGNDILMETQLEKLEEEYGLPDKVFKDKASGLNENRPGLKKMLTYIGESEGNPLVYVTNNDRLTRFGFKYLEDLISSYGGSVIVLDSKETKEPHEVLMEDFMCLIASFSGKFYRLRGWEQQKKLISKTKEILETK